MRVKAVCFLTVLSILFMAWNVQAGQVTVEYFHWTLPEFRPVPEEIYQLMRDIELEFQGQAVVVWYDIFDTTDPSLSDRLNQYNFTDFPAVGINGEYKMEGEEEIDGDELRRVIAEYLGTEIPDTEPDTEPDEPPDSGGTSSTGGSGFQFWTLGVVTAIAVIIVTWRLWPRKKRRRRTRKSRMRR